MRAALVLVGLVSALGQVALLRELSVACSGHELAYVLGLGSWLVASGSGAALAGVLGPGRRRLAAALAAAAVTTVSGVLVARGLRELAGVVAGLQLSLLWQLAGAVLVVGPAALACGAAFPLALGGPSTTRPAGLAESKGPPSLPRAYALETAGALVGGALATVLLALGVRTFTSALLAALAAAAGAALLTARARRVFALPPAALTLAVLALLPFAPRLDLALARHERPDLVEALDTPHGRLEVTRREHQVVAYLDGALLLDSEDVSLDAFATIAGLQRSAPRRVLILGGGLAGLAAGALRFAPSQVQLVELEPALFTRVEPELPDATRALLASAVIHRVVDDPRHALERAGGGLDLILLGVPGPETAAASRFYTVELFARAAEELGPGGVLALRLPGAENRWTPDLTRQLATVAAALHTAFADVVALPGDPVLLLASTQPLTRDPKLLATRLGRLADPGPAVTPALLDYLYSNDRFAELAQVVTSPTVEPSSDARPLSYRYALLASLERLEAPTALLRLRAELRNTPATPGKGPVLLVAAVVAALLLLVRSRPRLRCTALAALAGFGGMVFEGAILLAYQVKHGVLYRDVGLLLAAFMAGTALVALGWDTLMRRPPVQAMPRRTAFMATAGFGLSVALAARALAGGWGLPFVDVMALLVAGGSFVGAAFSHAGRDLDGEASTRPAASLYAADLAGGALGALAVGLVLVPGLGLPAALLAAALVAVGCLALV